MIDVQLANSSITKMELTMKVMGPIRFVANRMYYMEVQIQGGYGTSMLQVWKADIFDRRVARRIARRTGMKFTAQLDGRFKFRGNPK